MLTKLQLDLKRHKNNIFSLIFDVSCKQVCTFFDETFLGTKRLEKHTFICINGSYEISFNKQSDLVILGLMFNSQTIVILLIFSLNDLFINCLERLV